MSIIKDKDKKIYDIIQSELNRQNGYLELIASENFTSKAVLENTLSYNRDNSMVYMSLSKAYNENADFEEAIEILEELLGSIFRIFLRTEICSSTRPCLP